MPPEISQIYLTRSPDADPPEDPVYQPGLWGHARVHFVDAKSGVDCWRDVAALVPVDGKPSDNPWEHAAIGPADAWQTTAEPAEGVGFAKLPDELLRPKSYASWQKSLAGHLYRNHSLERWYAPSLKLYSADGESEADFRLRVVHSVRELRDEAVEKLRRKYGSKMALLDDRVQRARERLAREKAEFQTQTVETAVSFGESILRAILGRKLASVTNVRRASTTARRATRAAKEHRDIDRAQKDLDELLAKRADMEHAFEDDVARFDDKYRDARIDPYPIRPRKRDIIVEQVALAWIL